MCTKCVKAGQLVVLKEKLGDDQSRRYCADIVESRNWHLIKNIDIEHNSGFYRIIQYQPSCLVTQLDTAIPSSLKLSAFRKNHHQEQFGVR